MLSLVISVAASLVAFLGVYLPTESVGYGSLAAIVVFAVVFLLISRMIFKKLAVVMEGAQRDMMASRPELAIKKLEEGFSFAKWQFFIAPQINAQIGTIYYLKRDFTKAFPYLEKGFVKHWVAQAMLGISHMKRQKNSKMIATFEKATTASPKEPVLWAVYAYCLNKTGEKAKAVAALEKGLKKTGNNSDLQENLESLQESGKLKPQVFGDAWLQFHLEGTGALIKQQTKMVQGRRKIVRK